MGCFGRIDLTCNLSVNNMESEDKLTSEEELRAENELLRLKLQLDHGMQHSDSSMLTPETENQWLNHIYNFEQQYQNSQQVKVYDFVGRPAFSKLADLSGKDVSKALKDILSTMERKGIVLDCSCEYEDAVIYKFITEELFEYEMDNMSIEGMTHHFTYEEFHPNHNNDLRRQAKEFIESLLHRKWNAEFDNFQVSSEIAVNGKDYSAEGFSSVIITFQEGRTFHLHKFEVSRVGFNLEKGSAEVQGSLAYYANTNLTKSLFEGTMEIIFQYEFGYWSIRGFRIPGFGK